MWKINELERHSGSIIQIIKDAEVVGSVMIQHEDLELWRSIPSMLNTKQNEINARDLPKSRQI